MDGVKLGETGLKTAVETLVDPDAPVPGRMDGEQLDLLPLRKAEDGEEARNRGVSLPRGRGRPPGAKNKSTEDWTNFLLSNYSSPLQGLAETYARPLQDLAKELGCSKLEAYKIQMQAMINLAPYVHKKQPMAIDTGEGGLLTLVINSGNGHKPVADGGFMDMKILNSNSEENQGVTIDDLEKSNETESNDMG